MTTNKPEVQRYDDMGCPEEICRVDTMYESDDGDYVLYEDYEALQAECEKLRKDVTAPVEALERVMYCNEVKFLPEGVQQAVSDALAAHHIKENGNG